MRGLCALEWYGVWKERTSAVLQDVPVPKLLNMQNSDRAWSEPSSRGDSLLQQQESSRRNLGQKLLEKLRQ